VVVVVGVTVVVVVVGAAVVVVVVGAAVVVVVVGATVVVVVVGATVVVVVGQTVPVTQTPLQQICPARQQTVPFAPGHTRAWVGQH
jgi:hypothetical protein